MDLACGNDRETWRKLGGWREGFLTRLQRFSVERETASASAASLRDRALTVARRSSRMAALGRPSVLPSALARCRLVLCAWIDQSSV
jgi:hypothetical protein